MRLIALAVALSLLLAPLAAESQPAGKVYRIGVLETRRAALNAANLDAFRQGLRELGYRDGQNVDIAYRSSDGRNERFPALASELVSLKVDLILTRGTPAALAARNATQTIPVVMASSGDPVGAGLVASLGRPGGNVTGLSNYNVEIYAKRVELLKELLPKLTRIAGLFNMGQSGSPDSVERGGAGGAISRYAASASRRPTPRGAGPRLRHRGEGAYRSERSSPLSAGSHVRRSDPQGCETGRPPGRGPLDSAVAPVACGARDRLGAPDVRSSRT